MTDLPSYSSGYGKDGEGCFAVEPTAKSEVGILQLIE